MIKADDYGSFMLQLRRLHENTMQLLRGSDDMPHEHLFLLFSIFFEGNIRTTDIAKRFHLTPGAGTAIAAKLEAMGLIERKRDMTDRRVIFITLSEVGESYVQAKQQEHLAKLGSVLGLQAENQVHELVRLMDSFATVIGLAAQVSKD